jgi:hypothetical protein
VPGEEREVQVMDEWHVYKKAEQYSMAVEANMDRSPLTFNLILPTGNEEKPVLLLERVSLSAIDVFLDNPYEVCLVCDESCLALPRFILHGVCRDCRSTMPYLWTDMRTGKWIDQGE